MTHGAEEPLVCAARRILASLDSEARHMALLGAAAMTLSAAAGTGAAAMLGLAASGRAGERAAIGIAAAIGLGVAQQALEVAKWRCHALAELRLERTLTRAMFDRALRASMGAGLGGEMQALGNAIVGCRLIFQHLLFTAPTALIAAASAAVLIAGLGHVLLASAVLLFAPLYMAGAVWRFGDMARAAHAATASRVEAARRFADALSNREVVRAFRAHDFVAAGLDRSLRHVVRRTRLLVSLRTSASALAVGVYGAALGLVLCLAWTTAANDRAMLLVLTSLCLAALMRPLDMAAQALRDLVLARALVAHLPATPLPEIAAIARQDIGRGVDVRLERVSLAHRGRTMLLRDASLYCPAGSVTGLSGDSGVGKSSVVRLLTGEVGADAGVVLVDGAPPPPPHISVALQETFLLDDTIRANIAFGRAASGSEVDRAITIVGLDRLIASLPEGADTRVGERGARLSGGERQRVALARALLKPASLYLLDEATSALDPDSERAVMRSVRASIGEATMLIVAHRESAFEAADRVVELRDGTFSVRRDRAWRASAHTGPLSQAQDLRSPEART